MTKTFTLATAGILALAFGASAQSDQSRPLNESELLRTIDSLGTGDPTTKAPLSLSEPDAVGAQADPQDGEAPKGKGATEITAREASFDQKSHQAVFAGDVRVKNPEFNITCDKLTAFLKNENGKAANENGKAAPAAAARPAAAPAAPKQGPNTGGLQKAIAEGNVVITQEKLDSEGKPTSNIGRAKRAVYEADSGDVTLTGRPEVQQGINTIVALDESTVMILNREGRMKVVGPHKTVIKDSPETPKSNAR